MPAYSQQLTWLKLPEYALNTQQTYNLVEHRIEQKMGM